MLPSAEQIMALNGTGADWRAGHNVTGDSGVTIQGVRNAEHVKSAKLSSTRGNQGSSKEASEALQQWPICILLKCILAIQFGMLYTSARIVICQCHLS